MSIKGTTRELFIGKKSANIITFWGKKIHIDYDDLNNIECSYYNTENGGFLTFTTDTNRKIRFDFRKKTIKYILKAISIIQENNPDLRIIKQTIPAIPFYRKKTVIAISFLCCLMFLFIFVNTSEISNINQDNKSNEMNVVNNQPENTGITRTVIDDNQLNESLLNKVEAYSTTLSTGHYVVGIDIPEGTYSFFSKKGTGNLYANDGSVNVIFDYNNRAGNKMKEYGLNEFGTEEINNIYLKKDVILTVSGAQEISAGSNDAHVSSLTSRDQTDLKELEIGYGNYGAIEDIPAGTYDIEWKEGNGNIISDSANRDNGINEIMGNPEKVDYGFETDEMMNEFNQNTYIQKYNNFKIEEGDILKINSIKVKLIPSD